MTLTPRTTVGLFVASVMAAAVLASPAVSGQTQRESFVGFAVNMKEGPSGVTVDFVIDRWSTDAERERLVSLIKGKSDALQANQELLTVLKGMPKLGFIRTPLSGGWDLRYARQSPLEKGGRRIVLATDRPINFAEVRSTTPSTEYPFTIVEIQLDQTDNGVGKIMAGSRVFIDKENNIAIENFAKEPIWFRGITKVK